MLFVGKKGRRYVALWAETDFDGFDQKLYGEVVLEPQAPALFLLAKCCPGRKHGTRCLCSQ